MHDIHCLLIFSCQGLEKKRTCSIFLALKTFPVFKTITYPRGENLAVNPSVRSQMAIPVQTSFTSFLSRIAETSIQARKFPVMNLMKKCPFHVIVMKLDRLLVQLQDCSNFDFRIWIECECFLSYFEGWKPLFGECFKLKWYVWIWCIKGLGHLICLPSTVFCLSVLPSAVWLGLTQFGKLTGPPVEIWRNSYKFIL